MTKNERCWKDKQDHKMIQKNLKTGQHAGASEGLTDPDPLIKP